MSTIVDKEPVPEIIAPKEVQEVLGRKIHSSNIAEISLKAAFNGTAAPSDTPAPHDLYVKILKDFDHKIETDGLRKGHIDWREYKSEFVRLCSSPLPDGYELVPVMTVPTKTEDVDRVKLQFTRRIRPFFISYVANKYPDELRQLGFGETEILLAQNGQIHSGQCDVNIDHIIECSRSGPMVTSRGKDDLNEEKDGTSYLVNYFNNLIILPTKVHALKNKIRDLQTKLYDGEPNSWLLMLTPKYNPELSGFVCPKQTAKQFSMAHVTEIDATVSLIKSLAEKDGRKLFRQESSVHALNHVNKTLFNLVMMAKLEGKMVKRIKWIYCNSQLLTLHEKIKDIPEAGAGLLNFNVKEIGDIMKVYKYQNIIPLMLPPPKKDETTTTPTPPTPPKSNPPKIKNPSL